MIPQYNHSLVTSMMLWIENRLCNDGQGYINRNSPLYSQNNPTTPGYVWASPYKQWVYDSSVTGATIISGVYNSSGQFLTRASGMVFDFFNGRVISPNNWGDTLSGSFARKEVNVYFSTEEESNFLLEKIYKENINLGYAKTGVPSSRFAAPCIILTNARGNNSAFALGGLRETKSIIRCFTISDSNYLQEGINSLLMDSAQTCVPFCTPYDAPLNSSGDLKGADFNYITGIKNRFGTLNSVYIDNVYTFKMNEKANQNNNYVISITEFDVSSIRQP